MPRPSLAFATTTFVFIISFVFTVSSVAAAPSSITSPAPPSSSSPSPPPSPSISPPFRPRVAHHKANAALVALQQPDGGGMDEWAPYRMAFLLVFIAFSVALWVSYKILCESEQREEVAYQPLNSLLVMDRGGGPLQMRQIEVDEEEEEEGEGKGGWEVEMDEDGERMMGMDDASERMIMRHK